MKRDFQDKTFMLCCEHQKFKEYITGIPDLEECPQKEIIDKNYTGIRMDSLSKSPSLKILVNIEHQSTISNQIMFRNLKYYVDTRYKHDRETRLYIFHTGLRLTQNCYIYDNQVLHEPYLVQTYENDGTKTFKKIKNKINDNENIHPFEIFDLIWLPRFNNLEINDKFLNEYVDITKQLKDNEYYDLLSRTVFGWVNLLTSNEKTIKNATEELEMMSIESPEFKEYIATAIAEGRENRLEEKNKELERIIAQKDKEHQQTIAQKDKEHQQTIAQKDKEHQQTIAQKDKEIKQLKQKLAQKESQ
jgi:hypothetical protein